MPYPDIDTKIQKVAEAPRSIIDPFNDLINPIDKQFELLCEYNELYWQNYLTKKQLYFVEKSIGRKYAEQNGQIQRLDDMGILHVEFGSTEETFKAWMIIMSANNPDTRKGLVLTDQNHLRPRETGIYEYITSIYQININMVAYWNPHYARSACEIRNQAAVEGRLLAHSEILAALCLNPELYRAMDGKNLPNIYLAGYEMNAYKGSGKWDMIPCFCHRPDSDLPAFRIIPSDFCMPNCAAPVVLL